MQVALKGAPALAKLLFCLGMGRVGDLRPQLLLPPGLEVLRGAECHPSHHAVPRPDLLCPALAMRCWHCPPQYFPLFYGCRSWWPKGSGSHWPAAPHHPHIALWVLLQEVQRLGVTSKPVCRGSKHSARRREPILVTLWPSALHPSSMRIRVGWGAGRDAAVHGGQEAPAP